MIGTAYGGGGFWTKNRGLFTLAMLAGFFLALWIAADIADGRLRARAASAPGAVDLAFRRGDVELAPGRVVPLPSASYAAGSPFSLTLFGWIDGNTRISRQVAHVRLLYDGVPGAREYKVAGNFWDARMSRIGSRDVLSGVSEVVKLERGAKELGLLVTAGPEDRETGKVWLGRIAWAPDGGLTQTIRILRRIAGEAALFFGGCWLAAAFVASTAFRGGEFGRIALLFPAALVGWRLMFHRGTLEPLALGPYATMAWQLDGIPSPATESESPLLPWLLRLSEIRWDADFEAAAVVLALVVFFTVGWTVIRETRARPGWAEVLALVGMLGSPFFFGLPGCSGLMKQPGFADGVAVLFSALALCHVRAGVRLPAAALAFLAHPPLAVGMLLTGALVRVADSEDRFRTALRFVALLPALVVAKIAFSFWYRAAGYAVTEGERFRFVEQWGLAGMIHHITSEASRFFLGLHSWLWPFVVLLVLALWRTNRPVFWAFLAGEGIALVLQFLASDWHRVFEAVQWPALVFATGVAFRQAARPWRVALWAAAVFSAFGMLVGAGVLRLQ